jgi:hypothetical protein
VQAINVGTVSFLHLKASQVCRLQAPVIQFPRPPATPRCVRCTVAPATERRSSVRCCARRVLTSMRLRPQNTQRWRADRRCSVRSEQRDPFVHRAIAPEVRRGRPTHSSTWRGWNPCRAFSRPRRKLIAVNSSVTGSFGRWIEDPAAPSAPVIGAGMSSVPHEREARLALTLTHVNPERRVFPRASRLQSRAELAVASAAVGAVYRKRAAMAVTRIMVSRRRFNVGRRRKQHHREPFAKGSRKSFRWWKCRGGSG